MANERRYKTCCCCGEDAGKFEQHWNRDTGFGVCAACVARERKRGTPESEIRSLYGIEGVNYAAPVAHYHALNYCGDRDCAFCAPQAAR